MADGPDYGLERAKPISDPPIDITVYRRYLRCLSIHAPLTRETLDLNDGAAVGRAVSKGVQLVLNALWSYLFFGQQSPGAAFAEIIVLIIAIAITLVLFWRVSPVAGWLMVPYLAWVLFASYLNYTIWRLNT